MTVIDPWFLWSMISEQQILLSQIFSDLSPEDEMIPGDFKWVGGTTLPVEK